MRFLLIPEGSLKAEFAHTYFLRVAHRLHDRCKKDGYPRVYKAVGVGDTGFEVAPCVSNVPLNLFSFL